MVAIGLYFRAGERKLMAAKPLHPLLQSIICLDAHSHSDFVIHNSVIDADDWFNSAYVRIA